MIRISLQNNRYSEVRTDRRLPIPFAKVRKVNFIEILVLIYLKDTQCPFDPVDSKVGLKSMALTVLAASGTFAN